MAAGVRVWDLPTRLFHWAIVLLLPILWRTGETGALEWHRRVGYVMLGLILFRLIWGLIGSSTARFAGFVRGPAATWDYLRGRTTPEAGHNPIGALSVLAMLGLLTAQVALGLFATDEDGLVAGPLSHYLDYDTAREMAGIHGFVFNLIVLLVIVHVAAILYYLLFRRSNLTKAMLTGRGPAAAPMQSAPLWRFFTAAGLAAGLTALIATAL